MRDSSYRLAGHDIRVREAEHGRLWFLGHDITAFLCYPDGAHALHAYGHQGGLWFGDGERPVTWIDLENVYRLVVHCPLPQARQLADWLAATLLPGRYASARLLPVPLIARGLRLRSLHWHGERWIALNDALPLLQDG